MKNFRLAIFRNPKLFAASLFFGITSIWALCEPIISTIQTPINKYLFLIPFGLLSLIIAFVRAWPKKSVQFNLPNSNTNIEVKFGDLFQTKGNIAIAVNEFFDSEIGKPVSLKSIHGFFIDNVLGGNSKLFDDEVERELKNTNIENVSRKLAKNLRYEIGSTVPMKFGSKKYLLFALSKTNQEYEAFTNPSLILKALDGLLKKARSECNGYDLNIPIVGAGLSRSGLPAKYLIDLILISILKATKEGEITKNINLVLHESLYDEVDLNEIVRKWK